MVLPSGHRLLPPSGYRLLPPSGYRLLPPSGHRRAQGPAAARVAPGPRGARGPVLDAWRHTRAGEPVNGVPGRCGVAPGAFGDPGPHRWSSRRRGGIDTWSFRCFRPFGATIAHDQPAGDRTPQRLGRRPARSHGRRVCPRPDQGAGPAAGGPPHPAASLRTAGLAAGTAPDCSRGEPAPHISTSGPLLPVRAAAVTGRERRRRRHRSRRPVPRTHTERGVVHETHVNICGGARAAGTGCCL